VPRNGRRTDDVAGKGFGEKNPSGPASLQQGKLQSCGILSWQIARRTQSHKATIHAQSILQIMPSPFLVSDLPSPVLAICEQGKAPTRTLRRTARLAGAGFFLTPSKSRFPPAAGSWHSPSLSPTRKAGRVCKAERNKKGNLETNTAEPSKTRCLPISSTI